ncbi:hypothetical protein BV898_14557 [Hypsibius exemplaris]|uniref:Uncharacterized protein n=1 Tax=Hypsibius exemplaris TaxID=2072580 RepID=A0A9X6NC54_HYPEX|nr:hypothetical protein BV898_14557 [Hypsibius exemplaris]
MAAASEESLGAEKKGMRMRRGKDADKRYQSGARASAHDVKDHGLEIMDKLGGITISMGALASNKNARNVMGFIADESTCAGFALVGALETGAPPGTAAAEATEAAGRKGRKTTVHVHTADGEAHPVAKSSIGRRNFFVVTRDTSQEELERAFKTLSRRSDIAVLAINGELVERLQVLIGRHDAKAALPIIVPIPIDDDPYKCIEDRSLQRPKNFGFLNLSDPLQLFQQVEHEFEHDLYHFHSHDIDKHAHAAHHAHQGHY